MNIYQKQKPALIWMDIRMPIMDGLEATKIIRTMINEKQPIIIALSAHVFDEERVSILSDGFDDYLIKPFKESEIFHQIEKYLHMELEHDNVPINVSEGFDAVHIHSALNQLKAATKSSLYNAVILLDEELIQNEINMIEVENPDTAKQLRILADKLDYANLLKYLKEDKLNG